MSTPVVLSAHNAGHWLSFHIGIHLYAAPLADVNEVVREGDITPVPGSAHEVLGVRHLRGRIVPVLDGRRRLGVPPSLADPAQLRLVVLAHAGLLVGLRVDAVGELLCSDGIEIEPPLERASGSDDPVTGMLCWQGELVALLDVCRLCRL
ncbi:MAG: chemotaxis protein CheW [Rhodanobacter sp.]